MTSPPKTKLQLTQEIVVMMQRSLSRPVFVHEVEKHLQGFPVTSLGGEFRKSWYENQTKPNKLISIQYVK